MNFKTYREYVADAIGYANFMDDDDPRMDWLMLGTCGVHRDSHALDRSNHATAVKMFPDGVFVLGASHWAVGWVKYILFEPTEANIKVAEEITAELEDYPVLDEDDFSSEENDEAQETWAFMDTEERLAYMREHRHEFDFHGLRDAIAQARGEYFRGYASELLSR